MFSFLFNGSVGEMLAPVTSEVEQLHQAISENVVEKVRFLLHERKVDPKAVNSGGNAPIHSAAFFGRVEIIDELMTLGVDVNSLGRGGNSPIHFAASKGHLDAVNFLIERGGDLTLRNQLGKTAYDVADNHHNIRQLLLPLQLKAERARGIVTDIPGATRDLSQRAAVPPPPLGTTMPPPPPVGGAPPPGNAPLYSPTPVYTHAHLNPGGRAKPKSNVYRPIVADGFTSSAGDPVLAAKYGHQKAGAGTWTPPPLAEQGPGTSPTSGSSSAPMNATGAPSGSGSPPSGAGGPFQQQQRVQFINPSAPGPAQQAPTYTTFGSNPFGAGPRVGAGAGMGVGVGATATATATAGVASGVSAGAAPVPAVPTTASDGGLGTVGVLAPSVEVPAAGIALSGGPSPIAASRQVSASSEYSDVRLDDSDVSVEMMGADSGSIM